MDKVWTEKAKQWCDVKACFCIGPQGNDPVCPCRMRFLKIRNGRYVEEIDHGPVPDTDL